MFMRFKYTGKYTASIVPTTTMIIVSKNVLDSVCVCVGGIGFPCL